MRSMDDVWMWELVTFVTVTTVVVVALWVVLRAIF